ARGRSVVPIPATHDGPARSPRGDGRGLKSQLRRLLQDRLVQREVRDKPLQPRVLSLQILHPPRLIDLQAAIFLAPPIKRLLRYPDLSASLDGSRASSDQHIGFTQLRDNLFRR